MILYGVDVRGRVVGGGGRYDVSPVGDIGFCESVPCVFFFLNKKKQFPIIASLLENPLSGFHYPLMRRILCVIGLGGRSVYPITDTPTLR